jgi:polysaccharide biosynthesis transport protein
MRARFEALRVEALDLQRRSIQYDNLRREATTIRTLYEGLLQRHKEVDVAGGIGANNNFIVDRASPPGGPTGPHLMKALLMALVLGLGGGYGAAYLLERLDDAVHVPEEVEQLSGLPTLGVIPDVNDEAEQLLLDPRSGLAEAYRSLCTALQFATENGLPKSLLVTSAAPGEGKSVTSLAIARHFANKGLRVLLVDADLRDPSMHRKLRLDHSIGLSNYLTNQLSPPETFQATDIPSLTFMASGPLPTNAADLLASPRLLSLLSVGMETFDLIVLDSPPIMGLADGPLLSNAAAATLLVVSAGRTRSGQIRGALKRLRFGHYRVEGVMTGELRGPRGMRWRVRCPGAQKSRIGESEMLGGRTASWTAFSFALTVPAAECAAQELRLVLDARTHSERIASGNIWFDDLTVRREP